MKKPRKSWQEKLTAHEGFPKVFKIEPRHRQRWGEGTCVIPAPLEVDQIMRRVPKGKLITIDEIRKVLARRHGATIACPITTGIFAWIAAHAADEAAANGRVRITPFWRTLKTRGELNPKYPGGLDGLKRKLSAEGHQFIQKGKRVFVDSFASKLASLS